MDKSTISNIKDKVAKIAVYLDEWELKGVISAIEKDIVLEKLRSVYDEIICLRTSEITINVKEEKAIQPEVIEKQKKEKITPKPEPKIQVEEAEKLVEKGNTVEFEVETTLTKDVPIAETQVLKEKPQQEPEKEGKSKQILAEKLAKPEPLLHDVVAQKVLSTDLSTKYQQKEIESLNQSIQINDRFLFIKELFQGNAQLFSEAVFWLDNAKTYSEAEEYLASNFKIDFEKEAAKKLLQLLQRKYTK